MHFLMLDSDVLLEIIAYLSMEDALRLSATAKSIHIFARNHALRTVKLTSTDQIVPFCTYMLADVAGRLERMRSFTVNTSFSDIQKAYEQDKDWGVECLPELFKNARGLRVLSIPLFHTEVYCPLPKAISTLPNLVALEVKEAEPSGLAWLSSDYHSGQDYDLLPCLAPLVELESLHIEKLNFMPHTPALAPAMQSASVRSLHIISSDVSMAAFVRAFPNLRRLELDGIVDPTRQTATRQDPFADAHLTPCWRSLDFAYAQLHDFVQWPIRCPVHELHVAFWGPTSSVRTELVSVVHNMSPVVMHLSLRSLDGLDTDFWVRLFAGMPRVRMMELEVASRDWSPTWTVRRHLRVSAVRLIGAIHRPVWERH